MIGAIPDHIGQRWSGKALAVTRMLMTRASGMPDLFSAGELARATGVPVRRIRALIRAADIPTVDGELVARRDAVRACLALVDGDGAPTANEPGSGLFSRDRADPTRNGRSAGISLLVSGSIHAAVLVCIFVLASVAVPSARPDDLQNTPRELVQLVFISDPGPGGGGGGGGRRQPTPGPKAERKGTRPLSSPLPRRRPPKLVPPRLAPVRPRPRPRDREPLPPLLAPLATVAADTRDRVGLLEQVMTAPTQTASRGSGAGGGVGRGSGVGVGPGTGRGVGPGEGGGIGGGPYRPGNGIEPPGLLREVAPDYTEEARRAGLEGEVLLEIVVGPDGGVSEVRVLRRLGAGLDEEAVEAVRQWRFSPARRLGSPVAVIVEVAMDFKLR